PLPNPRELLPPLLACLPTSFVSPKPPPALLPLLTPILKQRVHLHTTSGPSSDSWLKLLSWDARRAEKLPEVVEEIHLEPHPVSGEIELEDVENIQYRRLDPETLHARLDLVEFGLVPIYLWCLGDGQGNEMGWKLAELRSREDKDDGTEWFESIDDANEDSGGTRSASSNAVQIDGNGSNGHTNGSSSVDDNDDDSYWASYDQTPGRTPAKRSPAPPSTTAVQVPSNTELEYFARYMSEVQPAMDPHDPSEEVLPAGESTLNGDTIMSSTREPQHEPLATTDLGALGYDSSLPPPPPQDVNRESDIIQPRPTSSGSLSVDSAKRLERKAENFSNAEVGIKQHISTDLKSLFRLARSAGIERSEFERIVRMELEMLPMMD
ncbi:hypothetical protein EJ08DRAFT_562890, partial [Tothia fuscella]